MKRLRLPILLLFFTLVTTFGYHIVLQNNPEAIFSVKSPWTITILIFTFTFFILRVIDVLIWTPARKKGSIMAPRLFVDIINVLILAIVMLYLANKVFNKSFTGIMAASGALGVILGISLQRIIADVFTGFAINMDKTIKLYDWIEYIPNGKNPIVGQVREINWRTVKILTYENNIVVIPNSALANDLIQNKSVPSNKTMDYAEVTLDFEVSTNRVINLLNAAAIGIKEVLDEPKPCVLIDRITESGIVYSIKYWVDINKSNMLVVKNKVLQSSIKHIHQSGLSLSYSKHDIYYKKMPKRQLDRYRDITPLLRRVPLFKMLNTVELEMIHSGVSEILSKPGGAIVKTGEPGTSMFIVVEGVLDVVVNKIHKGKRVQVTVNRLEPGDFFGEMSLLTGEPRSATIISKTNSVLYEIKKNSVLKVLKSRPTVGEELSKILAERVMANNKFQLANSENKKKLANSLFSKMRRFFFGTD